MCGWSRHPAANCVASPWPLGEIFACHQDNPHGDFYIDLNSGGGGRSADLRLPRNGWRSVPVRLALLEALWLDATLGDAAQAALAVEPSLNLAGWAWLAEQLLALGRIHKIAEPARRNDARRRL